MFLILLILGNGRLHSPGFRLLGHRFCSFFLFNVDQQHVFCSCSVPQHTNNTYHVPAKQALHFSKVCIVDRIGSDLRLFNFDGHHQSALCNFVYSKSKTSLLGSTDHKGLQILKGCRPLNTRIAKATQSHSHTNNNADQIDDVAFDFT
jgi:hypothetical protein